MSSAADSKRCRVEVIRHFTQRSKNLSLYGRQNVTRGAGAGDSLLQENVARGLMQMFRDFSRTSKAALAGHNDGRLDAEHAELAEERGINLLLASACSAFNLPSLWPAQRISVLNLIADEIDADAWRSPARIPAACCWWYPPPIRLPASAVGRRRRLYRASGTGRHPGACRIARVSLR